MCVCVCVFVSDKFPSAFIYSRGSKPCWSSSRSWGLEKDIRHEDMVDATGSLFKPLVVETFGPWHPHSMHILKMIAGKMAFIVVKLLVEC